SGPVASATVNIRSTAGRSSYEATTSANGQFNFSGLAAGTYNLFVTTASETIKAANPVIIREGEALNANLQVSAQERDLRIAAAEEVPSPQASGGERLSAGEVSSLPLNARDFSKLLLLAAGTMTDANGAANFTQQFAVNGQRGSTTVFALDGADTTDP